GIPSDNSTSPPFSTARTGTRTASDYSKPHSSGLKTVANEVAWGEQKAVDRGYCRGTEHPNMNSGNPPQTGEAPQRAGDSINLQDKNYKNDTPNNWLRGMPNESAMGKENFDPRGKDGLPKKW